MVLISSSMPGISTATSCLMSWSESPRSWLLWVMMTILTMTRGSRKSMLFSLRVRRCG